jgi:sialate O-acetylesterase
MVVQQEAAVPVQGEAAPGAEITVSFMDKTYRATADSSGAWRLFLDSHAPGGPYSMEITAGSNEKIVLDDIYVGDVWLCSGQSNMEMPMQRVKDNFPEEWEPPINALIRQFKVPQEGDFFFFFSEFSGGCW